MKTKIAILVDGSFFIRRVQANKRQYFPSAEDLTSQQMVECLKIVVRKHINNGHNREYNHHYRTYFYDAPPMAVDRAHYPLVEEGHVRQKVKVFNQDPEVIFRTALLEELKKQKKLALRLGTVKADKEWRIKDRVVQKLIKKELRFDDLTNDDFYYSLRQKGVDIKLGIDIATLSIGRQVDKIILIAGDSDFVPAAKLARTNGVDFVLDAMRNPVDPSLFEHIDGLVNFDIVSILRTVFGKDPEVKPKWWNEGEDEARHRNNKRKPLRPRGRADRL
ncbi:NYN domain-containing protein [Paenalcaligenes hominis]|uniref:NYN domain-containing protein n=1 Tax=Paenalcaligenes hominis TaxID=643674 RepID=UPI003523B613